jgi:hypothetical protein
MTKDGDYIDVRNACIKSLEPTVAELNDEYLRDTHVEGFTSIEQFIAEIEKDDPEMKIELDKARKALYTHPKQWQSLTKEEVWKAVINEDDMNFVQAIDKALREKNDD